MTFGEKWQKINFIKEKLTLGKRFLAGKMEKYVGKLVGKCGNWRKCGFDENGTKIFKNVKLVKNWNFWELEHFGLNFI